MRKVYVNLTVRLVMDIQEDTTIIDVIDELEYNFNDGTGKAWVNDTEITDWEVSDSK